MERDRLRWAYEAYVNKVLSIAQSVIKVFQTAKSPRLAKEKSGGLLPIIGGLQLPCRRAGTTYLLYFLRGPSARLTKTKFRQGRKSVH